MTAAIEEELAGELSIPQTDIQVLSMQYSRTVASPLLDGTAHAQPCQDLTSATLKTEVDALATDIHANLVARLSDKEIGTVTVLRNSIKTVVGSKPRDKPEEEAPLSVGALLGIIAGCLAFVGAIQLTVPTPAVLLGRVEVHPCNPQARIISVAQSLLLRPQGCGRPTLEICGFLPFFFVCAGRKTWTARKARASWSTGGGVSTSSPRASARSSDASSPGTAAPAELRIGRGGAATQAEDDGAHRAGRGRAGGGGGGA